jgi:hypothetical protein
MKSLTHTVATGYNAVPMLNVYGVKLGHLVFRYDILAVVQSCNGHDSPLLLYANICRIIELQCPSFGMHTFSMKNEDGSYDINLT